VPLAGFLLPEYPFLLPVLALGCSPHCSGPAEAGL